VHAEPKRTFSSFATGPPTWKAVYDPVAECTGVHVCKNTDSPTCNVVSVTTLIEVVGIDPCPAMPSRLKQTAVPLPPMEISRYAHEDHHRHIRDRSSLDLLLGG